MRLIDADVLKKYIDDCKCCEKCSKRMRNCNEDCELLDFLTRQWERVIDEQPTVEAKPIHRSTRTDENGVKWVFGEHGWERKEE